MCNGVGIYEGMAEARQVGKLVPEWGRLGGRKELALMKVDSTKRFVLGVDIGGTKLAAGVVSLAGEQRSRVRTLSRVAEGPASVTRRLIDLCQEALDQSGVPQTDVLASGVGCIGPLDLERGVIKAPANLPGWTDWPLVQRLQDGLQMPVYLENDANAAALGEYYFGAGRGAKNMVYLTISTGIGGGIIIGGQLYAGETGNAGEIGHMSVAFNGRLCSCGMRGCLEAYASGTAIAARAREAVKAGEPSVLAAMAGGPQGITAEAVVIALQQGDLLARDIWDETIAALAVGVANVINIFNPSRIVLGGGVTNAGDLLFVPLRQAVKRNAMPELARIVEILPAELGSQVGVLGAAVVAMDRHGLRG